MTYTLTGETYTDSRGWVWCEETYAVVHGSARTHWVLDNIDGLPCYGLGLHLWVGFNWMGDQKWHVGAGGSPRLDALYDSPQEAMENAFGTAIEYVSFRLMKVGKDFERAMMYAIAVLPKDNK